MSDCQSKGIIFSPLPAETFGGWHNGAAQYVKKLAGALAIHTGQENAQAVHHLFTRLALLLTKGNAALLMNPTFSDTDSHIE